MTSGYRPWGPLQWLIPKFGKVDWSLLGVLGTEERCAATLGASQGLLGSSRFLKIVDPQCSPASAFAERFDVMESALVAAGAQRQDVREVDLLQDIDTISDVVDDFVSSSSAHVILDITSMPKWWFYPVIRLLLADPRVEDVVVTYASAVAYGAQLSSDPAQLAPLPTFDQPRVLNRYDEVIVGVGFAPLGLRDLFDMDIGKIRYLFPFPPGPPNYFRNWRFLRTLEAEVANRDMRADDKWSVHMYDVPSMFDAMCTFTQGGLKSSALAPFGPKTSSLAMCIFALAVEDSGQEPVHVYYTQPRRYAIDYTTGVKTVAGRPDIKAYCLKSRGRNIFVI